MTNDTSASLIDKLGRKYLWWRPVDGLPFSEDRIVAQIMNLGTYDDVLQLEAALGHAHLADIMLRAEPGWFSDRSWEFWRGRLSFAMGAELPDKALRRDFHAATL
ncbi:hypothetical protein LPJ38_09000 [Bradyrhizobium daqingense]|nr:hypothetical protein [Bradyrhizobium daqingense]UFS90848.1 hypothetical protein LPJ38_09000 [Bradyrhizobium daqingense]